jgi:HK97 family phage prohead protease
MTIEYRYMRKAAPEASDDNILRGRAWVYGSPTTIGKGPYGFREVIRSGAGRKSVNDGDIVLLDNHEHRLPLARMSAGTLELKDGINGGDWEARVADTSYAHDVVKNVRAKNYGGCSFGFEVIRDRWTDDKGNPASPLDGTNREILEMKVHEISVCTFPAYDDTQVSAGSMMRAARGMSVSDPQDERAAAATYSDLSTCADCGATSQYGTYCTGCGHSMADTKPSGNYCSSCGADISNREEPHECEERDSKKPYGDVTYADPGYQKDKKKRYPLDTEEHVRAAWSYINQEANAKKYSAQQLASIKSKIKTAMTKFGIKADEQKSDEWQLLCDFREMTEGQDPEGDLNEVSFGVGPGAYVRTEDANALAKAIKEACDSPTRVAAIDLASNLGLADLLPEYWGPTGEIGSAASEDAVRDMKAIYEAAIELPATNESLTILNRAEPYLSELTIEEAKQPPAPDPDAEWMNPDNMRARLEEAKARIKEIDRYL